MNKKIVTKKQVLMWLIIAATVIFLVGCLAGLAGGFFIGKANAETVIVETVKYVEVVGDTDTENKPTYTSLGQFQATAYCCEDYPHICNDGDGTITATGTKTTVGRTIAVDPSVIPYGTEVIINGNKYIAEDTGSAIKGKRVDILFATHEEALAFGVQQVELFVLK